MKKTWCGDLDDRIGGVGREGVGSYSGVEGRSAILVLVGRVVPLARIAGVHHFLLQCRNLRQIFRGFIFRLGVSTASLRAVDLLLLSRARVGVSIVAPLLLHLVATLRPVPQLQAGISIVGPLLLHLVTTLRRAPQLQAGVSIVAPLLLHLVATLPPAPTDPIRLPVVRARVLHLVTIPPQGLTDLIRLLAVGARVLHLVIIQRQGLTGPIRLPAVGARVLQVVTNLAARLRDRVVVLSRDLITQLYRRLLIRQQRSRGVSVVGLALVLALVCRVEDRGWGAFR